MYVGHIQKTTHSFSFHVYLGHHVLGKARALIPKEGNLEFAGKGVLDAKLDKTNKLVKKCPQSEPLHYGWYF